MRRTSVGVWLITGFVAGLTCATTPAHAQDATPAPVRDTGFTLPDDTLRRIRTALDAEPLAVPRVRFYAEVVEKQQTIAEYLKGTDLRFGITKILPPAELGSSDGGGGGLDVLGLVLQAIDKVRATIREHQVRKIRERIDRELAALDGPR